MIEIASTDKDRPKSGIGGAAFNLVNSIVGAGIIGLPYALRQTGFVAGFLLIAFVSILTDKSLRIITELSKHPRLKPMKVETFEHLASLAYNKPGEYFILLNMMIMAYGAMVAYLLIIKDTVPSLLKYDNGIERELVLFVTSLTVIFPIMLKKDMSSLACTSLFSVLCDAIIVLFMIFRSPIGDTLEEDGGISEVVLKKSIQPNLFTGLGIISTAMACQHSCFIVYNSLERNTRARWATVTSSSLSVAFLLCAVFAVCGYLGFLDETYGDVLNNFSSQDNAANFARLLLAITMFLTYPMESQVAKHVSFVLLGPEGEDSNSSKWLGRNSKISLFLYVSSLIPALIFDDLGPVLSFTGSLGGSSIAYIAPGLTYLGIYGEEFIALTRFVCTQSKSGLETGIELSDARKAVPELPVAGEAQVVIRTKKLVKPWWWYPLLLPVWLKIASHGCNNLQRNTISAQLEFAPMQPEVSEEIAAAPRCKDFVIAIFFIVFGVIAAVAGLLSIFLIADDSPYQA